LRAGADALVLSNLQAVRLSSLEGGAAGIALSVFHYQAIWRSARFYDFSFKNGYLFERKD
jgi:hypothetical protein